MAVSDYPSWLNRLQKEPWFAKVAAAFADPSLPRPVDPALWEATLSIENSGLNPAAATYDPDPAGSPGWSYGLFQLRQPGLGSGQPIAKLETPEGNAKIAARYMSRALYTLPPTATLADKMRAIELAGWNGGLGQDAARQAALNGVINAGNQPQIAIPDGNGGVIVINGDGSTTTDTTGSTPPPLPLPDIPGAIKSATDSITGSLGNALLLMTIGGLFLALIAGGFAIFAGAGSADAPKPVPVPVPV